LNNEIEELKEVIVPKAAKKKSYFKRGFFKGLAGVLPALLTILVLVWCYKILRDYLGVHVNSVIEWMIRTVRLEKVAIEINTAIADAISPYITPAEPVKYALRLRPVVGIILSLVLIYIIGSFISSYVGRRLFPKVEKMLLRIPIVKAVYPYARQVTDFFLGEQAVRFERIVAVEYPRKGVYAVAFMTNENFRTLSEKTGKQMVVVFVPTSPTPVTGYTVLIPEDEVIPLDMSIDDALRLIITGGVIIPERERTRTSAPILQSGKVPPLNPGLSEKAK